MKSKKIRKIFFFTISSLSSFVLALDVSSILFVPKTINIQSNRNSLYSKINDQIGYKLGDLVDDYRGGFRVTTPKKIVFTNPISNDDLTTPNIDNPFVTIEFFENSIQITNSYKGSEELWNSTFELNEMGDQPTFEPINNKLPEKNMMRLSEYNSSSPIVGINTIMWDSKNISPTNISGNIRLHPSNSWLIQLNFLLKSNLPESKKPRFFIDVSETETPHWEIANDSHGVYKAANFTGINTFFVQDKLSLKSSLYTPSNKNSNTGPGDWKINDNEISKKYLSLPIELAFQELKKQPSDLFDIVDWRPTLVLPSMSDFNIWLVCNTDPQNQQWEINYGNNNNFKYVFYSKTIANNFLISPYIFDTSDKSPPIQPGSYTNIKALFEEYSTVSSIKGFAKGTYVLPGEYSLNKQRYASQVSVDELKNLIIKKIGNPHPDLSINDIILDENINDSLIYNNASGTILFKIILTKYIDNEGMLKEDPLGHQIGAEQSISGFLTIQPTELLEKNKIFNAQKTDLIATEQQPNDIAEIIYNNRKKLFTSLAIDIGGEDLKLSDISVSIDKASNTPSEISQTGWVNATVTLNANFLRKPDALIAKPSDPKYTFKITIVGYQVIKTTIFYESVNIMKPNEYATLENLESIASLISSNNKLFFENLPTDFNFNDQKDFKVNRIVIANNLGSPDVDNSNSGYLIVNITIGRYFDENGEIARNKTYNLTIYGYKKTGKTEINEKVVLNGYKNELVTNVVYDETTFKNIININQSAFFGNSYIPEDYFQHMTVTVDFRTNTNLEYQLIGTITLNKYFDQSGELIIVGQNGGVPLSRQVTVSGFKTIIPTSINSGNYDVIADLNQVIPSTLDDAMIQQIIFNEEKTIINGPIITGDKPNQFASQNIIIVRKIANNKLGTLDLEINLSLRFEDNEIGNVTEQPFPEPIKIVLSGFGQTKPTTVVESDPLIVNSKYPELKNTFVSDVINAIKKESENPQDLSDIEKKIIHNFKFFLWSEAFDGYKETPFYESQIRIISIYDSSIDYLAGAFKLKFALTKYMDEDGFIVEKELEATKTILGFKKVHPTEVNIFGSPFTAPSDKYGSYTVDEIIEDGILWQVIFDHDNQPGIKPNEKIIIGDIPTEFNFEKNLIITNIIPNSSLATITLDLTFNLYFSSVDGSLVVGNPPPPTTITIRGFEFLPITTINEKPITPNYLYPSINGLEKEIFYTNIQENSPIKMLTPKDFIDSMNSQTTDTILQNEIYIKSLFYFVQNGVGYDDIDKPLIINNPVPEWPMIVESLVIQESYQDEGKILFTIKVSGYYFESTNQPKQICSLNENNEIQNFAFIDLMLSGFSTKPFVTSNEEKLIPFIPIISSLSIVVLFVAMSIFTFSKIRRRSITTNKPEKSIFEEEI